MIVIIQSNTLAYLKFCEDAGIPKSHAECFVKIVESNTKQISNAIDDHLATKEDIKDLKIDISLLNKDMEKLDHKISSVDTKLNWLVGLVSILGTLIAVIHYFGK